MKVFVLLFSVFAIALAAQSSSEEEGGDHSSIQDLLGDEQPEQTVEEMGDSSPDPVHEDEQLETSRKKKSATTTFCVEVKPNNPYQKPYELCESGNEIYAVPSSEGHYSASSAASAPAPAPVYGPPQKTYTPIAQSNGYVQTASVHNAGYKSSGKTYDAKKYRANDDAMMEDSSEEEEHDHMRSAYGYGDSNYGSYGGYGGGLVKFIGADNKKHKKKGNGHSGVVITCQPNLAGYASPVQHGGYAGYGGAYRNSNQDATSHSQMKTMESTLGRSQNYGHHARGIPGYGNYGYAITPGHLASYGGSAYSSHSPGASYGGSAYSSHSPGASYPPGPAPGYSAPPPYSVPVPSYSAPSYSDPAPIYSVPSYSAPSPSYSAPSYSAPAPTYTIPSGHAAPVAYKSQAQKGIPSYSPPGTYRNTEGEDKLEKMHEEENKKAMETMNKIIDGRPKWNNQMRNEIDNRKDGTSTESQKKIK